jgi:hypothetical protein
MGAQILHSKKYEMFFGSALLALKMLTPMDPLQFLKVDNEHQDN